MGKAALGRFQPMLFKPVVEIGLSGVVGYSPVPYVSH